MANTKEDNTKYAKTEPTVEQSDAKNEQKDANAEQSSSKDEQKYAKTEQSVGSSNLSGKVESDTIPTNNSNTSQDRGTNKGDINMANTILTADKNGKFDFSNSKTYKTVKGDTLFGVAQDNGVPMQQLRYFNGLYKGIEQLPVGIDIHIPNGYVDVPVGK